MAYVKNPILAGFHPDPSILRVGDDYYIATSTFEWFPGVAIHHSQDLKHWELIGYPLTRTSQLPMRGNPDSGGVWAPCLSYDKGVYYLIYTNVTSFGGIFKDTHNYMVTAHHILGPWSEPIYLNSSGFDPSLFHDKDGRKWLVNMIWDYRSFKNSFGGIVIQEFTIKESRLIGEPRKIFAGTPLGFTEAPHLYRYGNFYYLITAEGGTSYEHAVTLARSKQLEGPYEVCPWNPILTSCPYPDMELQKAGHASLVEGPGDRWYLAHLCGRPIGKERRCILGRETALQEVVWEDEWLRMASGGDAPSSMVEILEHYLVTDSHMFQIVSQKRYFKEDFDQDTWSLSLQSLRCPLGERGNLKERRGSLRLYGKESLSSLQEQSLLAIRQQDFNMVATAKLEFSPKSFQQMAGMVYYYDTISHYYLYITWDEVEGRVLSILSNILGKHSQPIGVGVKLLKDAPLWLRLTVKEEIAHFSYSYDNEEFKSIGCTLDATVISDDYYVKLGLSRFTGAFIGICCQDLSGQGAFADFDYLEYQAL